MSEWVTAKFKDVAKVVTGKTPQTSKTEYYGGDISFVSPADLNESVLGKTKIYLTKQGADQVYIVPKNTVLVSCIGSLGKLAIVNKEVCFNQQINGLIFDESKIFPKYGFYFAQTLKPQLEKASSSTTLPIVNKSRFSELEIKYPSLAEQRRIASILDQADELRQKRQQAIEKLDQLLQATFIDMFGDPISNPKGWDVGCIGDMLESVKYGSSDKATLEGEIPILRMNNLTYSGEMDLTDLKYITKVQADEKYLVKEGDILFNRTNSKELVGKTAVYVGPEPMAYAGYLVRARTKANYAPEYISAFLNSPWGKEKLQSMCKSIVGMANINAKEFQSIVLPIPPENEQIQFKNKVLTIREKKRLLINQLSILDTLFKSLQNQAFSGNL
ncbi:restriction endonuclease subunit S [Acinetobacter pittii]|uniref:restriction endonuclease subunit S n=1 Tax=Acinetobacter pittii TaxID=48296 RepID=UPI002740D40A|nr:restriction endonuclease subunit S [Acinetobacter pittii]MDP7848047.1 restriction endonuclease subunit S [Acinetobacter pittii]MDP7872858.1 restriction endonuclease subunit S [Acinetobacter pittii]